MSIFTNIMNRAGFVSKAEIPSMITEAMKKEMEKVQPWMGSTADAQQWDMPSWEIFANQADLYRISPILGMAVDLLGRKIGTSKFNVKRVRGENTKDIPNHPFEMLLRSPNPLNSGLELMQYTISNYLLNGNAIWWLNKSDANAQPDEIWTMPFSRVKPIPDGRKYLSHYEYYPGAGKQPIRFETWEIVHFKTYNPNNDFYGLSPIESLVITLTGDTAMRRTNTRAYAEYGGSPASILAFKDYVNNEAWDSIKREVDDSAKRNAMMMLRGAGDGVTWMQRALSNKDMDFIAGLRQNMVDVFNRLCPGLVAMLDPNATEANALAARATFSEFTLYPNEEMIAQKITSDILPAYGLKLKGEFDDPRVVDRKLQLEEQNAYERSHTLEEVRAKYYDDEPLDDDRDDLIIMQINAQTGDGDEENKPMPMGVQPFNNTPSSPPTTEGEGQGEVTDQEEEADNEQEDLTAKAIKDLRRWRTMAMKGKQKAHSFVSASIPGPTMIAIKGKLVTVTEPKAIGALFDQFIEDMKPKPQIDPMLVLEGIRLGVRALEVKR